jgi:hypothetical protein
MLRVEMKGAATLATLFIVLIVALASVSATMQLTSKLDKVHQTFVTANESDFDLAAELDAESGAHAPSAFLEALSASTQTQAQSSRAATTANAPNTCVSRGGSCFNRGAGKCSLSALTGLCPGNNDIICCPKGGKVTASSGGNSAVTVTSGGGGEGTSSPKCAAKKGTCHDSTTNTCSSGFLAGLCVGASSIRCCTGTVKAGKSDDNSRDGDGSAKPVPSGPVKMPPFSILDQCYPRTDVKKMLGGAIDAAWITNTCAIRMSHTFNCAGGKANSAGLKIAPQGSESIKSANGENHIFRVKQFIPRQLTAKFGKPTLDVYPVKGSTRGIDMNVFKGHKGVIMWDTTGAWASATGHLSLLRADGTSVEAAMTAAKVQEYFDLSVNVKLWAAP